MFNKIIYFSGISAIIDLTWGGWIKGRKAAVEMGLPYIRVQGAENHPFVQAADDFLEKQVILIQYQTMSVIYNSKKKILHKCLNTFI